SATNQHKQEQNITGDGEVFSHWAVLKMIMAERAAQCLAKLGLNTATTTATSTNILHSQISQPQNIITTTDSTTIVSAKPNDLVTTSGHHR
ncbi:hypothetical protein WUBG_12160, partial [Wuchereria bancrofti]